MNIALRKTGLALLMAICLFGVSLTPISVNAEEETTGILENSPIPIEIGGEVAIYSDYVWRGFLLDDDPVVQPSVSIGAYGFTATFWSSFDMVEHDGLASDEVDATLDYTFEHDLFSLFGGHTWYYFPEAHGDTQEFYIGSGVNIPVGDELTLSPSVTAIYDYGDTGDGGAKGLYLMFDIGHSVPLFETGITLDLSNQTAWNHEFFIAGDGGYSLFSAGLTIPLLGDNVVLSSSANYSLPFGDLEDSGDGAQDDEFYWGGALAFSY